MSKKKHIVVLDGSLGKVRRRYRGFVTVEDVRRRIALYVGAVIVGVLVVLLVVWGVGSVVTEIIAPDKVAAVAPDSEDEFGESDAMTVLAVKLSDDRKAAEQLVLSRFEPSESRVYVCGLPAGLLYEGQTLAEHFTAGGLSGLAEAVAGLTGCEKAYTISMTYTELRRVVNIFGGVTITVPYMINYEDPSGERNLNVSAGTREYTGWETARLLNYPDWQGGEREHLNMYASVVSTIINDEMTCTTTDQLKEILMNLYAEADSDITTTDFQHHSSGLVYLCAVNNALTADDEPLAVVLDIWPQEADGGLEYDAEAYRLLRAAFSSRDTQEG